MVLLQLFGIELDMARIIDNILIGHDFPEGVGFFVAESFNPAGNISKTDKIDSFLCAANLCPVCRVTIERYIIGNKPGNPFAEHIPHDLFNPILEDIGKDDDDCPGKGILAIFLKRKNFHYRIYQKKRMIVL